MSVVQMLLAFSVTDRQNDVYITSGFISMMLQKKVCMPSFLCMKVPLLIETEENNLLLICNFKMGFEPLGPLIENRQRHMI